MLEWCRSLLVALSTSSFVLDRQSSIVSASHAFAMCEQNRSSRYKHSPFGPTCSETKLEPGVDLNQVFLETISLDAPHLDVLVSQIRSSRTEFGCE
jgi:hypothetical protein